MDMFILLQAWDVGLLQLPWETWGWQSIALLAVLISFFIDATLLMLGYGFQLEGLKRWAKAELLQTTASALLVILLVSLVTLGLNTALGAVIGGESTIICEGKQQTINESGTIGFVKCKLCEEAVQLNQLYNQLFQKNLGVERAASVIVSIAGVPIYDGQMVYFEDVQKAHFLGEKIVPLLVSLQAQWVLMNYISANMLMFFLPLGIILRIFPFTRGIGGLFIAIAIGLYVVFPTLYIMNDPTYVRTVSAPTEGDQFNQCYPGFGGVVTLVSSFETGGDIGGTVLSYESTAELLAEVTINIMFFPFIAFAATIVFISVLTPLLGGDMGEMMTMITKVV